MCCRDPISPTPPFPPSTSDSRLEQIGDVLARFLIIAAVIDQVVILLHVANLMVRWLWEKGLDPDNFSIPYLTALGDLLGTAFLALSFRLIHQISS